MNYNGKLVDKLISAAQCIDFEKAKACEEATKSCDVCEWHVHSKKYCELEVAYNALCNLIYFNVPHRNHQTI